VPDLCVHQLFEQQVERTPDAIALVFGEQEITYRELNARANQLAHHLRDLGVSAEVIVAVCLERSVELIISLLAILKAGGAYLPLDPAWPEERQHLLLEVAGCNHLLTAEGPEVVHSPRPVRGTVSGPPLAYVTYTSGSTGIPKGVAVEHTSIVRLVNPVNGYQLSAGHRVLQLAPMAFDASTLEIWGPLLNGGTLVIAPPGQLSLQELTEVLRQGRITTLWLTAGLFHAMVETELEALAGVRQVLAGGDVLSPEHVQRLLDAFPPGHGLINGYGPTENTTFTCCHRLPAGAMVGAAGVPLGRPIALTSLHVLGPSDQPCPIGIPGELHISGAGLARGYLNNPALTAEKFIPDPFSSDPTARLYKSGDLVSWNPDGTLTFHGRIDQQIKLRGFRIEPGEIEAQLLAHTAVAQAVVVLRNDDPANPRLIAYWVTQQPTRSTPAFEAAVPPAADQLRSFIAERLPDYMVPSAFVELAALPLNANGKLDRKALPAPSFSGNLEQRVASSTDLECQLHAIWAEVLGHSEFGVTDNFFMVGGHSLAAARLVSRINETYQCSDPLLSFFKDPTIAGQVGIILGAVDDRHSCIVPMQPDGDKPPLFIIHGLGGKISGWVDLARAFAPNRPVFGVQSYGADHNLGPQGSLEDMADHYAAEILRQQPEGVIHVMGYSAGGWFAYATVNSILKRGGRIGALVLLDTHPTPLSLSKKEQTIAFILLRHRRIVDFIRLLKLRSGLHLKTLLNPPIDQSRAEYIIEGYASLGFHARRILGIKLPLTTDLLRNPNLKAKGLDMPAIDPFVELHDRFVPQGAFIHVDILATVHKMKYLKKFWKRYALQGVTAHPLFDDHHDFIKSEHASELHAELERSMSDRE